MRTRSARVVRVGEPAARAPRRLNPVVLLAVALGGASGALLRHGTDQAFAVAALDFPWPTLAVNTSGSASLALLGVVPAVRGRPVLLGFCGPGLLGGWTTLSTYAEQGRRLLEGGRPGLAAGYLLGTLVGCLLACTAAAALGRRLVPPPGGGGGPR